MTGSGRGHVARKRFGQNFLVDRAVVAAIVDAIAPRADDRMIEIGPGLAALTEPLVAAREAARAIDAGPRVPLEAIELDRDLAAKLERRFAPERLVVHRADVLDFDFAARAEPFRVVGNLPYNISTPLLFRLRDAADRVIDQHFMLQREVVARMVAAPGTSDYGRLSVMLQVRYAMDALFDVPPAAFDPPPAVTSSFVRMVPLPVSDVPAVDPRRFAEIVALAFSQRRKMLRNTLATYADGMAAVGIAPTARAEEIDPATYVALARYVDATTRTAMSGKPSM